MTHSELRISKDVFVTWLLKNKNKMSYRPWTVYTHPIAQFQMENKRKRYVIFEEHCEDYETRSVIRPLPLWAVDFNKNLNYGDEYQFLHLAEMIDYDRVKKEVPNNEYYDDDDYYDDYDDDGWWEENDEENNW